MDGFFVEAVVLCAVFHLGIYLVIRYKPEWEIYSYPPAITQRWIELGKVPVKEVPPLSERLKQKLPAAILMATLLGALVYFLNGCRSLVSGFLVSYPDADLDCRSRRCRRDRRTCILKIYRENKDRNTWSSKDEIKEPRGCA